MDDFELGRERQMERELEREFELDGWNGIDVRVSPRGGWVALDVRVRGHGSVTHMSAAEARALAAELERAAERLEQHEGEEE